MTDQQIYDLNVKMNYAIDVTIEAVREKDWNAANFMFNQIMLVVNTIDQSPAGPNSERVWNIVEELEENITYNLKLSQTA